MICLLFIGLSFESSWLFELIDQNKDEFASSLELKDFTCRIGKQCKTSKESLEFAMNRLDLDGDGFLSEMELFGSMFKKINDPETP